MGGKAVASKKKKTGSHDRMRYLKSQQAQPARKTFLVFVKKNTRQLIMGVKPGNK